MSVNIKTVHNYNYVHWVIAFHNVDELEVVIVSSTENNETYTFKGSGLYVTKEIKFPATLTLKKLDDAAKVEFV